jgi:DNA mismatch repair protein MutS
MKKRTPAQQQYHELKQQNSDCVLFFRMGDFYEMFHEDAHIAHKVLGITLTARDKTSANPIPMAGFPYHALDRYLPKLIDA